MAKFAALEPLQMWRLNLLPAIGMAFLLMHHAAAKTQDVAATPPMGWNSWNHFGDRVDEAVVRAQADAMVSSGMRDAGYTYVNIDDTWEGERDARGIIRSNSKFPDMKALADFVHSKGLKLGIYSSPGSKTCAKFEGSLGHEVQDAQAYAAWEGSVAGKRARGSKLALCGANPATRCVLSQSVETVVACSAKSGG